VVFGFTLIRCARNSALLLAALSLLVPAHWATAQTTLPVQRLTLSNGLTVLALEDHTLPSITYYTVFKVGSRNEHPGITGLSHLFEHMMFNGSARYKPKVIDQVLEAGGGYSNAFTDTDTTEYYDEFGTSTLGALLPIEADRMRALKLDRANIEQERGIVKEERRANTDNNVASAITEALWNSAFVAHPYRWEPIGFMKDIDAIRLDDAKTYFRTYYAPNNAVICVVGDFDTRSLFAMMRHDYGPIPRQPAPRPVVNAEPPQPGERRIAFHKAAELPAVTIGYHVGTIRDADDPALDLLAVILAQGESARLYRSLVYDKQIATSVSASNESRLDPGLFTFYVQAQTGHTAAECEAALYAVLDEIKQSGVTERELQKARNTLRVQFLSQFKTNLGRATLIAEDEANLGDWRRLYRYLPDRDRVTVADIQRIARKYFSDRSRTVVTLIPEKADSDNARSDSRSEKEAAR
jgi:predicted Zn-dependent peptidase